MGRGIWLCVLLCMLRVTSSEESLSYSIIVALENTLQYYANNYMHMNLDGIFGLRLIEGQIMVIMDELQATRTTVHSPIHRRKRQTDDPLMTLLKSLRQQAANVSELAQETLRQSDENYYDKMKSLVIRPWRFAKPFGLSAVDAELKWLPTNSKLNTDTMDEEQSDQCMGELIGVGTEPVPCKITSRCIELMTISGRSGYHLTHQLLYGMLAEQCGCLPVLNQRLSPTKSTIEMLRAVLCTNNFYEVSKTVRKYDGIIPTNLQDLFLEQELICPMLGYSEFLHRDWLIQILAWQKPSGCWGQPARDQPAPLIALNNNVVNNNKINNNKKYDDAVVVSSTTNVQPVENLVNNGLAAPRLQSRHLLYEKVLNDGCLSHKTAVAVGALVQYLRFILSADKHFAAELHGMNYLMKPWHVMHKPGQQTITAPTELQRVANVKLEVIHRVTNDPRRVVVADTKQGDNDADSVGKKEGIDGQAVYDQQGEPANGRLSDVHVDVKVERDSNVLGEVHVNNADAQKQHEKSGEMADTANEATYDDAAEVELDDDVRHDINKRHQQRHVNNPLPPVAIASDIKSRHEAHTANHKRRRSRSSVVSNSRAFQESQSRSLFSISLWIIAVLLLTLFLFRLLRGRRALSVVLRCCRWV